MMKSMDSEKVGKYISKLRKNEGLTQEELAEKIGVNSKTISKWETGINVPDTVLLFELSKVFKVSVQDILNGDKIETLDKNDYVIIKGITFYNKIFKKKITKIFFFVLIFIIFVFSVLYTINNYNKNLLYDIKSDNDDFAINGFLINNNNESIFILNDITFQSSVISTDLEPKIKQYSVAIQSGDESVNYYSTENEFEQLMNISDVVNTINITFVSNNDIMNNIHNNDLGDIYFVISYSNNNKLEKHKIQLIFDKHYSNNKILY